MVYQIKYDDIMSVGAFTNSTSKAYSDQLEAISKSISPIISMNQLKGQAADSVKTYLAEVHGNILGSIGQIIQEYQVRFLLYKDGYFQEIDNDLHAQLDEKVFDELVSFFKSSKNAFELEQVNLDSTIGTINDILATKISGQNVLQSYDDASKKVNDLRTKTGEYETKHKNADLVNFKNMLQALKLLIADYQGRNSNVVTQYEAGGIATANGAQDLSAALQASAAGMQASQSQIEAAGSREEERWKAFEKELADARKEKGMWNAVFAVGAIVIGGAAIVLTAGAATPLVVTAAVAGTASMAYGASNLVEAGQDIYYGANGDGFSMAINPLRDTIFMGNQQAYDIFGLAATTVAGLCIPVGTGLKAAETAAKTAGTTVTRQLVTQAVAKELGKEAITGAVAGGTGYATNWAANEFLPQFVGEDAARNIGIGGSLLTGLAAGWGTYKGLSNMSVFQVKAVPTTLNAVNRPDVSNPNFGVVQSRINLANGRTRFTPIRPATGKPVSAGFEHVLDGHFNRPVANSRSIFSVTADKLKQILQSSKVVKSTVSEMPGGQFKRIVDTETIVGTTALKHGGNPTSWIEVITDKAGNLITTYPVPKP